MLKEFYTAIKGRLNSIVTVTPDPDPEKPYIVTPVIQKVDMWNNQYQYEDQYPAFKFPHVFVEFVSLPWESIGGKAQQASAIVRFHIGSRSLNQDNLEHFDLLDVINYWMSGFNGTNFGTFTRISTDVDHLRDELVAHVVTYRVRITDTSAVRDFTTITGDKLFIQRAIFNSTPTPLIPEPDPETDPEPEV